MSKITNNINDFAKNVDLTLSTDLTLTGFVKETPIKSNDINVYIKLGVNFIKGFVDFAKETFALDTRGIITSDYIIDETTNRETFFNLINDTFKIIYLYNVRDYFETIYKQLVPNGTIIYGETLNYPVSTIKDLEGCYPRIQYSDYGKIEGSNEFYIDKITTHTHSIRMTAKVKNSSELVGGFDGANFKWKSNYNYYPADEEGEVEIYRFKQTILSMETTAQETDLYTFDLGTNSVLNTGYGNPVELDTLRYQMLGGRIEDNSLNSTAFTYQNVDLSSFNIHPFASKRQNLDQIIISDNLKINGFQPNTIISADEWTIYIYLINNFVSAFITFLDNENETKLDEDFTSKDVNNIFNNFNIKICKEWLQQFFDIIHPVNSYFLSSEVEGYPKNDDAWVNSTWESVFAHYPSPTTLFFDSSIGNYGTGSFTINVSNIPQHTHFILNDTLATIKGYTKLDETPITNALEKFNTLQWSSDLETQSIDSYKLETSLQTIKYTYSAFIAKNIGSESELKYDFTPVNMIFLLYKRTK